jgi:hypothetical protein
LGKASMAKVIEARIDKWDCIGRVCKAKETITRMKSHPTEWKKMINILNI